MTSPIKQIIQRLANGKTVRFRVGGNSMSGCIEHGQLVTIEPVRGDDIEVGDAVLCRARRQIYLHLVVARDGDRYQIGNNRGHLNGWIDRSRIYGKCVRVDP